MKPTLSSGCSVGEALSCRPLQTVSGELLQAAGGDPYAGEWWHTGMRALGPYYKWSVAFGGDGSDLRNPDREPAPMSPQQAGGGSEALRHADFLVVGGGDLRTSS
jgi:hypothetical protein